MNYFLPFDAHCLMVFSEERDTITYLGLKSTYMKPLK